MEGEVPITIMIVGNIRRIKQHGNKVTMLLWLMTV